MPAPKLMQDFQIIATKAEISEDGKMAAVYLTAVTHTPVVLRMRRQVLQRLCDQASAELKRAKPLPRKPKTEQP